MGESLAMSLLSLAFVNRAESFSLALESETPYIHILNSEWVYVYVCQLRLLRQQKPIFLSMIHNAHNFLAA